MQRRPPGLRRSQSACEEASARTVKTRLHRRQMLSGKRCIPVRLHRFSRNGGDYGGAVVGGMKYFTALALRGYLSPEQFGATRPCRRMSDRTTTKFILMLLLLL
jgi:hypothetical protein